MNFTSPSKHLPPNSDQDSIKHITHKVRRQSIDGKTRVKRLMSTFGIYPEHFENIEQASVNNRVRQWFVEFKFHFTSYII